MEPSFRLGSSASHTAGATPGQFQGTAGATTGPVQDFIAALRQSSSGQRTPGAVPGVAASGVAAASATPPANRGGGGGGGGGGVPGNEQVDDETRNVTQLMGLSIMINPSRQECFTTHGPAATARVWGGLASSVLDEMPHLNARFAVLALAMLQPHPRADTSFINNAPQALRKLMKAMVGRWMGDNVLAVNNTEELPSHVNIEEYNHIDEELSAAVFAMLVIEYYGNKKNALVSMLMDAHSDEVYWTKQNAVQTVLDAIDEDESFFAVSLQNAQSARPAIR